MVDNVAELLSKKEYINTLAVVYSAKNDAVRVRIDEQISAGVFSFIDVDPTVLQVLKNDSLTAFTSINRIVLAVNQDLILEGNITRFRANYERAIQNLGIQQKNISFHVLSLGEPLYQELSQQLTRTYTEIASLIPTLTNLYLENQHISQDVQNHKQEISRITQHITEQSDILRAQKHKNSTTLQWLGQGAIMLFLLFGGYLFARSITNPLIILTKSTRAVAGGDYSQELDITGQDEIGQLAHDFNQMRESLKKSFELIDEQKAQYQSIFENAIEGIFQSLPDGTLLRANQALADISGYTSPEEMLQSISNTRDQLYVNPPDHDTFVKFLEADGAVRGFESSFTRKDGSIIPVLINAQAIHDEHRKTSIFQGMIEDISQKKQAEEYRIAKEAAEKSNRAKSEFLSNMSHELRTPLNAILGFTQVMARNSRLPDEERENLSIIQRSGEHLLLLINQVLDLSKIEAGHITLSEKNFDLYRLLDDLEDMFSLKAQSKGVQLVFERVDDIPRRIRSDQVKLRQVLINLLNNAIKFTVEGGVAVKVTKVTKVTEVESAKRQTPNVTLKFSISDSGPGIAPEEMEKVFEAFGQTETGRQSKEGTGLGLSISRKFVQLMGGDMRIKSDGRHGTLFTFDIQAQEVDESEMASHLPARRILAVAPGQPRYRILIVDDRWTNRQLVVKLLQPLGFELREAANGQEAVEMWQRWKPHLIWMDMRMPILNGYDAARRIRARETRRPDHKTRIIALTASSLEEERARVLDVGCDDYLRKPFRETELFELMSKHIGVRFVYEETEGHTEETVKPEALAALPAEWLARLKQGAEEADFEVLFAIIEQIRTHNSSLADTLTRLTHNFRYDEILTLLSPIIEETR